MLERLTENGAMMLPARDTMLPLPTACVLKRRGELRQIARMEDKWNTDDTESDGQLPVAPVHPPANNPI